MRFNVKLKLIGIREGNKIDIKRVGCYKSKGM